MPIGSRVLGSMAPGGYGGLIPGPVGGKGGPGGLFCRLPGPAGPGGAPGAVTGVVVEAVVVVVLAVDVGAAVEAVVVADEASDIGTDDRLDWGALAEASNEPPAFSPSDSLAAGSAAASVLLLGS